MRCNICVGAFQLVEVNAHSLFSKWFSESGKLVNKLFDTIKVCLLLLGPVSQSPPNRIVCVVFHVIH